MPARHVNSLRVRSKSSFACQCLCVSMWARNHHCNALHLMQGPKDSKVRVDTVVRLNKNKFCSAEGIRISLSAANAMLQGQSEASTNASGIACVDSLALIAISNIYVGALNAGLSSGTVHYSSSFVHDDECYTCYGTCAHVYA